MLNGKVVSMMFAQLIFGLSFYGAMTILTPFFLEKLQYSEAQTMLIVGAFSALGTLFALAGGFIGDRVIGEYRALNVSFICFTLGFGLLAFSAFQANVPLSLVGIALVIYARGLKATNYSTLYRYLFANYEAYEKSFTINYSVNNIGSLIATYAFPFLAVAVAYHGSFLLSGLLCALAVVSLWFNRKPIVEKAKAIDNMPVALKHWGLFTVASVAMIGLVFFMFSDMKTGKYIVYAISMASAIYFIYLTVKANYADRLRMLCITIMLIFTIIFFVYYGQMMTSMNIVAINTMRGDLLGFIPIKPEGSQVMNPIWCIVAGPVISYVFARLEHRGIYVSTASKVAIAFVFTAIAFGILTWVVKGIQPDLVISPDMFLLINLFQAFAEVVIGSLVVSFIVENAPKAYSSFSVSMNMVATSLGGMLAAVFSTQVALDKGQKLTRDFAINTYGEFFMTLTVLAVAMAVVAFAGAFAIKKMLKAADIWEAQQGLS